MKTLEEYYNQMAQEVLNRLNIEVENIETKEEILNANNLQSILSIKL